MFNVILLILLIHLTITGSIRWTLQENPAIFGTNIHLICHLPTDTCCNDYRKWNVGNQHTLITVNGLSYKKSKYKEDLFVKDRVSVLTIFSMSEQDVNIPYECVYGFQTYTAFLALTEDVFEYHPTEKIPVIPTVTWEKGYDVIFKIQFQKVFPLPVCHATLGTKNLTAFISMTVIRKAIFYESSLAFNYSSSVTSCDYLLTASCTVGKTVLPVVHYKACPYVREDTIWRITVIVVLVISVTILFIRVIVIEAVRVVRYVRRVRPCSHHQDDVIEDEHMI